jgi:hypothetical protein
MRNALLSITVVCIATAAAFGWVTIRRGFSARDNPSAIETLIATPVGELSPFSLPTFSVCGLRVLRSMKEEAGRTENRAASTSFRVGFTQLTTTIGALRAGRSWAGEADCIC